MQNCICLLSRIHYIIVKVDYDDANITSNKILHVMIEALISYWINVQAGQLNYFVGSHVWVEDPDEAWIDGEILESKDDEITISYESGTKVNLLESMFITNTDTNTYCLVFVAP
jgi:hypothetical protein